MPAYSLAKAALHKYTEILANENHNLTVSVCSPGYTTTNMTKGMKCKATPEESTAPMLHCLFNRFVGNGWYYGPDCVRSPLHAFRKDGSPGFNGY